ncbi:hypothetical protein PHMEG_00019358 [Phytophthora megakarya]|uniref:GAG-pre-integrase domain-containing protein n=1 Tax=Phytophthora megakarya TaxID=4795 RepID=A0A225VTM0_9STRA|nr:hypothetical protein PHMEG_00019358 [Phytophthora megakarya]
MADVSRSDWVLDSGCGYGLTAEATMFVRKQASEEFRFSFGEGTKLSNTHVGTVKLHFQGPDVLAFVAIAVNGAYYIHSRTLRDRQIYCSAVKTRPVKALHVPGHTRVEATLKEWHIKLGHLNRDKLIEVMSCNLIPGVQTFIRKTLQQ